MTVLKIETRINAPIQTVFDLARSIDLHLESAAQTKEKVIAGRKSGLIEEGETVTFRARHFGFNLSHQSLIAQMQKPFFFIDEMTSGCFKSFRHEHFFSEIDSVTTMADEIRYEAPFGIFGRLFDSLVLKNYLLEFIKTRNQVLKAEAEKQ